MIEADKTAGEVRAAHGLMKPQKDEMQTAGQKVQARVSRISRNEVPPQYAAVNTE